MGPRPASGGGWLSEAEEAVLVGTCGEGEGETAEGVGSIGMRTSLAGAGTAGAPSADFWCRVRVQ